MNAEEQDDLRSTAEAIVTDASRLVEIEETKLGLDPADPRTVGLSEEAERLGEELAIKTSIEKELAEDTAGG